MRTIRNNTTTQPDVDFLEMTDDDPHGEWDANRQLAETVTAEHEADSLNDTLAAIARATGGK